MRCGMPEDDRQESVVPKGGEPTEGSSEAAKNPARSPMDAGFFAALRMTNLPDFWNLLRNACTAGHAVCPTKRSARTTVAAVLSGKSSPAVLAAFSPRAERANPGPPSPRRFGRDRFTLPPRRPDIERGMVDPAVKIAMAVCVLLVGACAAMLFRRDGPRPAPNRPWNNS